MADSNPLGDLLGMFGGSNPLSGIGKTLDQFKKGVGDFLSAIETFKTTMDSMNEVAARVNRLIDDVEPPIRAFMPQVTRAVETADFLIDQISGPIERVAPALASLADTLSAPSFTDLSSQVGEFLDTLAGVGRSLSPLTQLAESAGSLFGLRGLSRLAGGPSRVVEPAATVPPPPPPDSPRPAAQPLASPTDTAPAKKAAAPTKKAAPAKKAVAPANKAAPAKKAAATKKAAAPTKQAATPVRKKPPITAK